MQVLLAKHWHRLALDQTVELPKTDLERGLGLLDVKHRQGRFDPNVLTPRKWLGRQRARNETEG